MAIPQPHFHRVGHTLANRLDTFLDVFLELIRPNVVEILASDVGHEVAHRRTGLEDELIRDIPHFAERLHGHAREFGQNLF